MKSIHEMHDAIGDAVNGAAAAVYNYHLTSQDLYGILAGVFIVFIIVLIAAIAAGVSQPTVQRPAYDGAAEHARRRAVVKAILDAENARRRERNRRLRAWAARLLAVQPNGK
jgi:hypothetical protein